MTRAGLLVRVRVALAMTPLAASAATPSDIDYYRLVPGFVAGRK
jgi:hypothetical protein